MKPILDQSSDSNGQVLYKLLALSSLVPIPDFVKDASSEDIVGTKLPASCYADPVHRQFPMHTKAAVLVSRLFVHENDESLTCKQASSILQRLADRATFFGITSELKQLEDSLTKQSCLITPLTDDDYALVINDNNGKDRRYLIRNSEEVKAAVAYLDKYQDHLPRDWRKQMAEKLASKADKLGLKLSDTDQEFLDKQAGFGTCSSETASKLIKSRIDVISAIDKSAEILADLKCLDAICKSDASYIKNDLTKLASIIDDVDRAYNLIPMYDSTLDRPETLFSITEKVASELVNDYCESSTGNLYKLADLKQADVESMRSVFGDEFVDSVCAAGLVVSPTKLAEQLFALPRKDVETLDKILLKSGVLPVSNKQASVDSKWSDRDFLRKLAKSRV